MYSLYICILFMVPLSAFYSFFPSLRSSFYLPSFPSLFSFLYIFYNTTPTFKTRFLRDLMLRTFLMLMNLLYTYYVRDLLLFFRNGIYAVRSLHVLLFSFFTEMKLCSFYLLCKKFLNMVFCFSL